MIFNPNQLSEEHLQKSWTDHLNQPCYGDFQNPNGNKKNLKFQSPRKDIQKALIKETYASLVNSVKT